MFGFDRITLCVYDPHIGSITRSNHPTFLLRLRRFG